VDKLVAKKKVLVIGGGFGGVFAAKALARLGRGKLDVELVNANNYFVFSRCCRRSPPRPSPPLTPSCRCANCFATFRCARPRSWASTLPRRR
jgi:flavin-dependent dehydrogenase